MLNNFKTLTGYKLDSLNGEIGKARDFYFDDQHWAIRYLVADTGGWLTGRQVLISPYALLEIKNNEHISVDLTKQQIEESPALAADKPVSRQFEIAFYGYYGWPVYWGGPYMWGTYPYLARTRQQWNETSRTGQEWDSHLRSAHDVTGHHIEAADGEIGHVEDFILDDENWAIRYMVVDTRNWWPGKKVLISPQWIERVSWNESKVFVNVPRETIKQSPEYLEGSLTREYENDLYQRYGRQGYWVDEPAVSHSDP